MKIISGKQKTPWKVCLYGTPGFGKSSWASLAPKPLMIDLEKGIDRIEADKTPYIKTWTTGSDDNPGLLEAMTFAANSDYETIVFDTAEGLEQIVTLDVLGERESLADFGYGKGWEMLEGHWRRLLDMMDRLTLRGKNVLVVAHDKIEKFESPTSESYDRYSIRLHKRIVGPLVDRMDAVLFGRYEMYLKNKGEKDFSGNEKKRAIGDGKRIIHTAERPAWVAKNRFDLPETMDLSPEIFSLFN